MRCECIFILCSFWCLQLGCPAKPAEASPGFADPDTPKPLTLPPGSRAVWEGTNYFGCVAVVLEDPAVKVSGTTRSSGYVRVQVRGFLLPLIEDDAGVCVCLGKPSMPYFAEA